ncbi:hypothetical protein [Bacteroides sp.]|uniref:hypothetical protein n=1 Tax=Bacteroides sp. TaxID=29523 RepID=UPI00261DE1D2|nr:hypothetical protein [Bacteroides sp.]MDD3040912.1 hypothetical protein [Bacteroides sp.]
MKDKLEIHSKVCGTFIEMVLEKNLPVNISVGRPYREPNGSLQNPVELEYDKGNKQLVYKALTDSINQTLEME